MVGKGDGDRALTLCGGLMNISLGMQGGGSQMRNTIYGTLRRCGRTQGDAPTQIAPAGVPAHVGRLCGFIHCG